MKIFTYILGSIRLVGLLIILLIWIIPMIISSIGKDFQNRLRIGAQYRKRMAQSFSRFLGLRYHYHGTPPEPVGLIIANHRSYGDPVPIALKRPIVPVVKMEVDRWPLIGWLVRRTGVLYVQRDDKGSRRSVRQEILRGLDAGQWIIVFFEGTTTDNSELQHIHPGAIASTLDAGLPVHLVYIDYRDRSHCWINAEQFLSHFIRVFGAWRSDVDITWGPSLQGAYTEETLETIRDWYNPRIKSYIEEYWT